MALDGSENWVGRLRDRKTFGTRGGDGRDALARAIAATFARRNTPIPPDPPFALTHAFADDRAEQQQWTSFVENIDAELVPLGTIIEELAAFLMPHAAAARRFSNVVE